MEINTDNLSKNELEDALEQIRQINKNTKVNVLIVGGTGVGKSSTINALFNIDDAKVGQSARPETNSIYHYSDPEKHIVIWDTPGLGDNQEKDEHYKQLITRKLNEKDSNEQFLIDLVLLILDGSSRDYSSAYTLLREVIVPNLNSETGERLLVAINQADMAMKGRYWDRENNCPMPELANFLDEKILSTKERIFHETGLDIEPIYYSAGYKDGANEQKPYNLNALLNYILRKLPNKKRIAIFSDRNSNEANFKHNDNKENYQKKNERMIWESIKNFLIDSSGKILSVAKEEFMTPENIIKALKFIVSLIKK
ncbi:50S ribosome-binding GTPase [Actinobacillus equuli subsp. haemolyticus]|uniref:GTPase family protein n=1 Tax=Actinobacillus equuli TaxID=718 RepID=UPI00244238E9|nr:GTPase [Actinobacillus equuli]WGE66698.1 50S ribosome-binding GTPase [Actinobacillus equuli subsp. haemolyticus]